MEGGMGEEEVRKRGRKRLVKENLDPDTTEGLVLSVDR